MKYEFAIFFSFLWSQPSVGQLWSMWLCIIWFNRRSKMSIVVAYLCNLIQLHLINQFNYYILTWFSISHQWWWWWWQYLTIFHMSLTEMYWRMEARQRHGVYREIWVVNHGCTHAMAVVGFALSMSPAFTSNQSGRNEVMSTISTNN